MILKYIYLGAILVGCVIGAREIWRSRVRKMATACEDVREMQRLRGWSKL